MSVDKDGHMGKYGDTAVRTAERLRAGHLSAEDAWRAVAAEVFAGAPEAMRKTCPREAFLGLCQAGLLAGIPAGRCTPAESGRNRRYAAEAVRLLLAEPGLADGGKAVLWRRVMRACGEDPGKRPNEQMDVVLSLWRKRLIDDDAVLESH